MRNNRVRGFGDLGLECIEMSSDPANGLLLRDSHLVLFDSRPLQYSVKAI